ncbi:MAG: hypothetical protein H6Q10_399 [Acidobacteria bacterium]|nr:hypothetical protein [Acidobacteriota bacterium]
MTTSLRLVVALAGLAFAACGGNQSSSAPTSPSSPTSGSHNAGANCLNCHSFTFAGTAYKPDGSTYPGAVVKLTSAPGGAGTTLATVTADASGNFHTTTAVSFGAGVYATATGTGGASRPMTAATTSGACNSCHTSGNRIVVQ